MTGERINADQTGNGYQPADGQAGSARSENGSKSDKKDKPAPAGRAGGDASAGTGTTKANPLFSADRLPDTRSREHVEPRLPLLGEAVVLHSETSQTLPDMREMELRGMFDSEKDGKKGDKPARPGPATANAPDERSAGQAPAGATPAEQAGEVREPGHVDDVKAPDVKPQEKPSAETAEPGAGGKTESGRNGDREAEPDEAVGDTSSAGRAEARDEGEGHDQGRDESHSGNHEEAEPAYPYAAYESGGNTPPPLPPNPFEFLQGMPEPDRPDGQDPRMEAMMMDVEPVADRPSELSDSPGRVRTPAGKYESDIPPGLQRSARDVSRAAAGGALVGWWLGRRGKRKAVLKAFEAGKAQAEANGGPLEAQTLHEYPAAESGRPVIVPSRVETTPAGVRRPERLVGAAVSVIALERLRPDLRPKAVPRPAALAAERLMVREVAKPAVLPAAERPVPSSPEAPADIRMNDRELLQTAKSIRIEGVSLKDIFEARRIDKEGLRQVVAVFLRGGNYREQLRREITAKEMSFERDPLFRHNRRSAEDNGKTASAEKPGALKRGLAAAQENLGPTGARLAQAAQSTAGKAGKAVASGTKQATDKLVERGDNEMWYGITAIVIVYSIIVLLFITW